MAHDFAGSFTDEHLERISYPLGGIGTGGMCLTGSGELEAVGLRHKPTLFRNPLLFASIHLAGVEDGARVLEGPIASWRPHFPWGQRFHDSGGGCRGTSYGFPRFAEASFRDRFPAAEVALSDPSLPLTVTLTAWSPFIPGDADASSRPVIVMEYALTNTGAASLEATLGMHSEHTMRCRDDQGVSIERRVDGFVLRQDAVEKAAEEGSLRIALEGDDVKVDSAWFRGGWFDTATMLWRGIAAGRHEDRELPGAGHGPKGGSVTGRLTLAPGETRTVRVRLSWFVPFSEVDAGRGDCCAEGSEPGCCDAVHHRPRYAKLHRDVDQVDAWLVDNLDDLKARSVRTGELLAAGDLPGELREAVIANLGILRSPTVLRQYDGRLWLWEGCFDGAGCCHGSCTHVWNWAQATAHLFPELERGLRETEHTESQLPDGGQSFRVPLPIEQIKKKWWTAADGQLGGVIKVWREWRIGGDAGWLRALWPKVEASLEHCIRTWDPQRTGVLRGPQHNTYDIEFHGPNGMSMSCYLGALVAAADMSTAAGAGGGDYAALADRCRAYLEQELWDGRSFIQQLEVRDDVGEHLRSIAGDDTSPELKALLDAEGPRYQYTTGVLATAILGEWLAAVSGLETGLDREKVRTYLRAVTTHNLRRDLSTHANPQRCSYALGAEGGLIVCTWPDGDSPALPFPYSEEVWTGLEWQHASHLLRHGMVADALELARLARTRYDGRVRNPFDEIECGHWYGRALSSYDLLGAYGGARYDAVTRTMHLDPAVAGDLSLPFIQGTAMGLVGVRDGQPFYEPWAGELAIEAWAYTPAAAAAGV